MTSWNFPASEPIDVSVGIASGSVTITAESTDAVTVDIDLVRDWSRTFARRSTVHDADADQLAESMDVSYADGRLDVREVRPRSIGWRGTSLQVAIVVPAGSACEVRTASADVTCRGDVSALAVRTASGGVQAGSVQGPAEILTMSGDVRVDDVSGDSTFHTASGQVRLRHAAGDVTARTASGDIAIGRADGSVTIRTASGRVRISSVRRGTTDVSSVSGDVEVRVAHGTGVYLALASVTGRVRSDLEPTEQDGAADLHIRCKTVSGALHVARAAMADAAA